MKKRWKACIIAAAAFVLMMTAPAMAESQDNIGFAGSCTAIRHYYEQVRGGERSLYHVKTEEEILEDARAAALGTYENIGIVDIGSGYLNVREEPGENARIIGKMLDGYAGEIIGESDNWYLISSGDVEGYVSKDFVLSGKAAQKKALEVMQLRVQITAETLNVRTEPKEDAELWTQVNVSERYPVVGNLGDWIEIELDTSTGYVSSDYVEIRYSLEKAVEVKEDPATTLRNRIVNYAMQYLGNPYVWGGESLTNGCDCSGFVMLVYREFGVDLPHYSVSQSNCGTRIKSDTMKPGDLVFYANRYGTINHVTMYIGDGKIIGAQSSREGIRIRSWDYRTPVKIVSLID